jgi:TetR/AcrR family transcriptional regulator, transcriptional repressor of bet genes
MSSDEPSRREAILAATVDEVLKNGFDGTSIQQIANRAGVSPGLVMYHFKTKEELFTAAWVASVNHFSSRVTDSGETVTGLDRMERSFRILFVDRDEMTAPWDLWLELWAKAARSPELRQLHAQQLQEVRGYYTKHLQTGLDSGDLKQDLDPELVGDLLHTLVYGLAVKVTLDSEIIPPERALEIARLAIRLVRDESKQDERPEGK